MTRLENDTADNEVAMKLPNEALTTEQVFVLSYKRHYFMAKDIHSESVKTEFLAHAKEEIVHIDFIAKKITELGYAG